MLALSSPDDGIIAYQHSSAHPLIRSSAHPLIRLSAHPLIIPRGCFLEQGAGKSLRPDHAHNHGFSGSHIHGLRRVIRPTSDYSNCGRRSHPFPPMETKKSLCAHVYGAHRMKQRQRALPKVSFETSDSSS